MMKTEQKGCYSIHTPRLSDVNLRFKRSPPSTCSSAPWHCLNAPTAGCHCRPGYNSHQPRIHQATVWTQANSGNCLPHLVGSLELILRKTAV